MAVAPRTQLLKQFGFKKETTWATAVTVDHFLPIIDFEPEGGPEVTYSDAIVSGKVADEYGYVGTGNESYKFAVGGEVYDHGMMALFELMLGAVATTGAGPYTHTITAGEPIPSFTAQIVAADSAGTARALTYAGSVFESFELNFEPGKRVTWGGKATAKTETSATAAATLAYPTTLVPAHGQNVAVSVIGSALNVKSCKLTGEVPLTYDERRYLGSTTIGARQVAQGKRSFKAEIMLELENNFVEYLRFKNQATGSTSMTVTVGSNTITITLPTSRMIEGHPTFKGAGLVEQPLTIEGLSWGVFEPINLVCVNSDATV